MPRTAAPLAHSLIRRGLARKSRSRQQQGSTKTHAVHKAAESGIAADWVEVGVSLYELQNIRLFLNSLLERGKRLLVIAEAQISVDECCRGNIAGALAPLQIGKEPERIRAAASESVGSDEHAGNCRATLGECEGSFEHGDRFG